MTTFYQYRQNNSGGSLLSPALYVYIEADSPEEANAIAEYRCDIYFDDDYSIDCKCCGTRWDRVDDFSKTFTKDTIWVTTLYEDEHARKNKVPVQKIIRKE